MVFEAHSMSFPCTEHLLFNYAKVNLVFYSMAPLRCQICNVYRQEFNSTSHQKGGGQLKNQPPSKAPPPPQRKSARFFLLWNKGMCGNASQRHSFIS